MRKTIVVTDEWQKNYEYDLVEAEGQNFDAGFKPDLTPKQMLELGVFDGHYFWDKPKEFPADWFSHAKLSGKEPDPSLNFFKIHASAPLEYWQKKGWIYRDDPRGWFQWYCRYFMGRRIAGEDLRQINRWRAIRRHIAQIKHNCNRGDLTCRPRQRQALLHWAYDSRKF